MRYITLTELKKHLCIDADFTEDDTLLTMYGDVAELTVQRNICSLLSELVEGGALPAPLKQAILLYAGTLYNARESVSFGSNPSTIPFTYGYLIDLYRNYKDTTSDEFIANTLDDVVKATFLSDTPEEEEQAPYGDVAISTTDKAIKHIAESVVVDEGGYKVNIERI